MSEPFSYGSGFFFEPGKKPTFEGEEMPREGRGGNQGVKKNALSAGKSRQGKLRLFLLWIF
jgi:hypothetical protein